MVAGALGEDTDAAGVEQAVMAERRPAALGVAPSRSATSQRAARRRVLVLLVVAENVLRDRGVHIALRGVGHGKYPRRALVGEVRQRVLRQFAHLGGVHL